MSKALSRTMIGALAGVMMVSGAVLTIAAGALAAPKKPESIHVEYCDVGRSLVESVASARDQGVPRSFALAQVEETQASHEAKEAMRMIVESVYKSDNISPSLAGRAFMEGCMQGGKKPARAKVAS